jgi:hypothetical protein
MQAAPGSGPERMGRSLNDQAASNAKSELCVARMHFPSAVRCPLLACAVQAALFQWVQAAPGDGSSR